MDNRAEKLVTSTRHSCYVTDSCQAAQTPYRGCRALRRQLSRARPCPQPACSFVAQQAAANVTAGLALGRATDCKASGDTRATLMWQNVATIGKGELPAALRQSRLHSISAGDNRALIVWDNKSHRECANAIGWAHLTYAQQSDIWQLVTFLPQMLRGFVSVQCVVQIQYSILPLLGSSLVPEALSPTSGRRGFLVP